MMRESRPSGVYLKHNERGEFGLRWAAVPYEFVLIVICSHHQSNFDRYTSGAGVASKGDENW
jgi:hypothetical protein